MRFGVKILYFCLLFVVSSVIGTNSLVALEVYEMSLKSVIEEAKDSTQEFVEPDDKKLIKMANISKKLIIAISDDELSGIDNINQLAYELGFEIIRLMKDSSKSFIVLREKKEHLNGGGIYIFRPISLREPRNQRMNTHNASRDTINEITIIQAPHSRYDLNTGYISRSVFENTDIFALFMNTAHRYEEDEYEDKSDLAHNENTYFQIITQTVCNYFPSALIVQFHGYSSAKHKHIEQKISIILSEGTGRFYRKPAFQKITKRLVDILGKESVGIFGVNVYELGGTTNVQAQYINRYSDDTFIHIEMSEELREDFLQDKHIRTNFIKVFY